MPSMKFKQEKIIMRHALFNFWKLPFKELTMNAIISIKLHPFKAKNEKEWIKSWQSTKIKKKSIS